VAQQSVTKFIAMVLKQSTEISCQFLLPGGSMVPRYVLQLLFSEKCKSDYSATTEAIEKMESLKF
jgi:hypothetical protein